MNIDPYADGLLKRLRGGPASIEASAEAMHTSPATIEAAAASLQQRGYRVVSTHARTLRLESVPDLLLADEIEPALSGRRFGRPLHSYGRLGSTNVVARRLAEAGAPEGTVVTAEEQTEGRGRQGRSWHSPAGVGVWMSAVMRPRISPSAAAGLPLVAALAVSAALRDVTEADIGIKWPNDVHVGGKKLAGILGESVVEGDRVRYTVLGMGINVNQVDTDMPGWLQDSACSLAMITHRRWARVDVLAAVLSALETRYDAYCREGFDPLRAEFTAYSSLLGRQVRLVRRSDEISGTVLDLTPEGSLVLATESATVHIHVGDATLRYI